VTERRGYGIRRVQGTQRSERRLMDRITHPTSFDRRT
jgi:hypothetical protein